MATYSYGPGEAPLSTQSFWSLVGPFSVEPGRLLTWYKDFVSASPHYIIVESTLSGTKVIKKLRKLPLLSTRDQVIFYAKIRNYECKNVLSTFKFNILEKTIKQAWSTVAKSTSDGVARSVDVIETMLGTYAARNLPLEQKGLTKIEKSWIMVSSFTKYL